MSNWWFWVGAPIVVALYLIGRLFEPVAAYPFGWSDLPDRTGAPALFETTDPEWRAAANAAEQALRAAYRSSDHPALSIAVADADGRL